MSNAAQPLLVKFDSFSCKPDGDHVMKSIGRSPSTVDIYPCLKIGHNYYVMIDKDSDTKGIMFTAISGQSNWWDWEIREVTMEDAMNDMSINLDEKALDSILPFLDMAKQGQNEELFDYFQIGEPLEESPITMEEVLELLQEQSSSRDTIAHVPSSLMIWAAAAMDFNADMEGRGRWKKNFNERRLLSNLLYHTYSVMDGNEYDEMSGIHNYAHMAAILSMLIWDKKNKLNEKK